jgi:hypothetical protein
MAAPTSDCKSLKKSLANGEPLQNALKRRLLAQLCRPGATGSRPLARETELQRRAWDLAPRLGMEVLRQEQRGTYRPTCGPRLFASLLQSRADELVKSRAGGNLWHRFTCIKCGPCGWLVVGDRRRLLG